MVKKPSANYTPSDVSSSSMKISSFSAVSPPQIF